VALTGATPVFVDVDEATFTTWTANSLKSAWQASRPRSRLGLKPKAVIPVDLFGQSADHDAIAAIAESRRHFLLLDDSRAGVSAQATRASRLGSFGPRDGNQLSSRQNRSAASATAEQIIYRRRRTGGRRLRSIRVHGQGF